VDKSPQQGEQVMSDKFQMTVGQAHELDMAFDRNGWSAVEVKRLSEGDVLTAVRNVILGHAEIRPIEHVIDCDADPFTSSGWKVEEHKKGGLFKWDPKQVQLHLSSGQQNGKYIEGNKLRKELADKPVLNANVLDYLLAHPHLIPEEWKGKYVFFWGTIYRDSGGYFYVRYLYWLGGAWSWSCCWLGGDWSGDSPAALRAS